MSLQTVAIALAELVATGDLGDNNDLTGELATAPASQGNAETTPATLGLTCPHADVIHGIKFRFRGQATTDAPPLLVWQNASGRMKWRVGSDQAEVQPLTPLPKDAPIDWIESPEITTQPNGGAWTRTAVEALQAWHRVAWTPRALGFMTLSIVEARVIVYAQVQADVPTASVGAGDLPAVLVGGELPVVNVGAGTLPVAWVGEEE